MTDSIVFFIFLFVVIGLFFHFCVPNGTTSEENKRSPSFPSYDKREVGETLIFDTLSPFTNASYETRKKHIENIENAC